MTNIMANLSQSKKIVAIKWIGLFALMAIYLIVSMIYRPCCKNNMKPLGRDIVVFRLLRRKEGLVMGKEMCNIGAIVAIKEWIAEAMRLMMLGRPDPGKWKED